MSDTVWILGGGQMQLSSIDVAHQMGLKTIVSDRDPQCACRGSTDEFYGVDIFDIPSHMALLQARRDVMGVFAAGIDCPETAAVMQTHLGKPTAPPHIACLCHDKVQFRRAMRRLGWPTPRFADEVSLFSSRPTSCPPYPCIVKNTDASGSRGTKIFRDPSSCSDFEWNSAITRAIEASPSQVALIEELWEGTEHTVETLFDAYGTFYPCFITDRHFDYSNGYALEIGLRHPSTLPDYIQRKAYQVAEGMANDLGIKYGPFKLDIMVTDDGVRVLEATTRFSGGFDCQVLIPAATGKEILKAGILTCMGKGGVAGLLKPKWNKVALSGSMWPRPGTITKIDVSRARQVPGVVDIIMRKKVGDVVEPYVDCTKRVGWIFTVGDTHDDAEDVMIEALSYVVVETSP